MVRKLVLTALAAAAALVPASTADAEFFVAYGTGLTQCTITTRDEQRLLGLAPWYRIQGETKCDRPIEQTAQMVMTNGHFDGGLCSGVRASCYSGEPTAPYASNEFVEGFPPSGDLEFRVTLRSPDGQGWLGSPNYCTGIGTDNLKCVFPENALWNAGIAA